jgi:hypothetical protein
MQILTEDVYRGFGRRWPASTWPTARFVRHDSTEENLRVLLIYLDRPDRAARIKAMQP